MRTTFYIIFCLEFLPTLLFLIFLSLLSICQNKQKTSLLLSVTLLKNILRIITLLISVNLILKKQPDFDPRNYGYKKLVDLIKDMPEIEIDERRTDKKNVSHFYVRTK